MYNYMHAISANYTRLNRLLKYKMTILYFLFVVKIIQEFKIF